MSSGAKCRGSKGIKVLKDIGNSGAGGSQAVWISRGGLRARILPFGATLQDLRLAPFANPLVLALPDNAYAGSHRTLYSGAIVGRVAGRIRRGRCDVEGVPLQLDMNNGPHHLHGGTVGFAHRDWSVEQLGPDAITLSLISRAGEAGYPATVKVTARYDVLANHVLSLTLEAQSDAKTLLNLCHHPYFNLSGAATIADHKLQSPAARYLPADAAAMPTGQIANVSNTVFDFRTPRMLGKQSYDNSLCLHEGRCGPLVFAARLDGGREGPAMEIWTTQPALHVFSGAGVAEGVDRDGRVIGPYAAVALEAQGWPAAPNHPEFPSVTLEADTLYRQVTQYRFS